MEEKKSLPVNETEPEKANQGSEEIKKTPEFDTAVLEDEAIFAATDAVAQQSAEAAQAKAGEKGAVKKQNAPKKKEPAAVKSPEEKKTEKKAPETKEAEKVNWGKEIRDWVVAIAVAVALAMVIRNFVFTLVKVQGQSMEPTLQNEDRLYVNRFFYTPEKGDVIIFKPATDPKRPYVKRVIATEGDSVYIDFETGDVYVNDQLVDEPYIKEKTRRSGSYIMSLVARGEYGRETPIVVQPGHIFVMGDNRNNSKDSRELGQVPLDEVMGGAVFRFWPLSQFGSVHRDALATSCLPEEEISLPEDSKYGLG